MNDYMDFDVRVIERKVKLGEITKEQYKKFLNSLEEVTSYAEIDEDALVKEAGIKKKDA